MEELYTEEPRMEMKSHVYIKTDENNNITRIEGEYSLPSDLTDWILIEEGEPCDRLNHAQSHYLEKPIMDEHGLYNYAYINNEIVEKNLEEEIAELERRKNLESERAELIRELEDTDYIANKIIEATALYGSADSVIAEYREVLLNRENIRHRINDIDAELI